MKITGLLSFIVGATDTAKGPEVAPDGIVIAMDVALQELIVTAVSFSNTTLLPCVAPNPLPEITAGLPIAPVVGATLAITGAGEEAELTETLSNAAVARAVVLPLVTAKPTYTFCAMLIVCAVPSCTQLTPSADT